ncbi:MAG: NUDIX domain-containing protein [Cyanophyceae cyanobacterium]
MNTSNVPHFSEGSPQFSRVFLESTVYGQSLDALVIACVDVVLIWGDHVLLGQRKQPPRDDWWVIGGRMVHGESPLKAAQRKLQEEAGLTDIKESRLEFIGVLSTRFSERSQPPQHHGLHSINLTYRLKLTDAEGQGIQLDSAEYGRCQWFTLPEISHHLQNSLEMDRALALTVKLSMTEQDTPNS